MLLDLLTSSKTATPSGLLSVNFISNSPPATTYATNQTFSVESIYITANGAVIFSASQSHNKPLTVGLHHTLFAYLSVTPGPFSS